MARLGWDIKSAGIVLDMNPKKIPQALGPTFNKVARLMLADPSKTLTEIQEAIDRVRAERARPVPQR